MVSYITLSRYLLIMEEQPSCKVPNTWHCIPLLHSNMLNFHPGIAKFSILNNSVSREPQNNLVFLTEIRKSSLIE